MYRYLTINKLKGEVLKMRFLDRLAEFSILTKLAILLSLSFVLISSLALLIFLPTVSSSKIKPNFLPYQHFLPGTAGYIIENPNLTDIRALWVVPKVNCFKSYTDTPHLVNQGLLLSSVTENSDFSNLNSALVVTSSNCSRGAAVYELTIRIGKYTVDINAGNTIKAEVKLLESKKTQQTYTRPTLKTPRQGRDTSQPGR